MKKLTQPLAVLKTVMNGPLDLPAARFPRWLAAAALCGLCLNLAAQTQESRNGLVVSVPNGYANIQREDLSVQSAIGSVAWSRRWDGQEWKFNASWESLSQSWKNLTGSQTADTTASSFSGSGSAAAASTQASFSSSGGGDSGCWVLVDEDWKPSFGTASIGGVPQAGPMQPARMTPFNRLMGESSLDYPAPQIVNIDYATLCAGGGGTLSSGRAQVDTEGIRRANELYLGDGGRYAFNNRSVLEKRSVRQLPVGSAAALYAAMATGQYSLAPANNSKGFRWLDKGGDYIDYNTQGQAVAYGDRNNNLIWLLRDTDGLVRGVIDGNGRVLFSLTYTGLLVTEIKDYAIPGLATDLAARSVKYAYDASNRLTQVTDARGGITQYDYDGANRIVKITNPKAQTEQITYVGEIVAKVVAADGGTTDYLFEYDATNKQFSSKITGPETGAGRRSESLTHNRVGKLVRRTVNGRIELEVGYDTGARAQIETSSRGFATKYVKNEFDQMIETAHPDNTARKASYSASHLQMTEETDEAGFKTQFQYDSIGNLLKAIQAVGTPDERTVDYERNSKGFPVRITRKGRTEVNGSITQDAVLQLEYDAQGEISKVTDPEGHARNYTYNRLGQLVRFVDTKGKASVMTYDADGNMLTETDALGQVSTYTYDANSNQATVTDARGKVYRFAYDAKDRLAKRVDPLGGEYASSYNFYDQTSNVTDASGKGMRMEYDALVRLVKSVDTKAQTYEMGYAEADGQDKNYKRPSTIRYPTMSRLMRYNERDRLSLQSSNAGTETRVESFTYDGLSRRKTFTDANGKTKYYVYNPHGEVVEVKDPLGNTMRMQRDTRGNVIQVTDPNGRAYSMRYDRRNLLVGSTDPLNASTSYSFDTNGFLSQITQANGQQVKYSYDEIGRVTEQQEFNALSALQKTTSYTYDASGNLLTWNDGQYSASRTYDDNDRLSSEIVNHSAAAGSTSSFSLSHAYTYYGNGQIKTYTGPDGQTIGYQYDGAAQLEQVSIPGEGNIAVTEWQWFQPKKVLLPGGSEQRMEYDGYQSLTRLKVVNPAQATLFELQNQYGKLAEIKQATSDGNPLKYTYDDAGRLSQVNASVLSSRSESFGLDAGNNRTSHSKTGSTLWQYDNANQLIQRPAPGGNGTVSYQYDASGNQTVKTLSALAEPFRTTRYSYDALNRLSQVSDGAGQLIASYSYDPFDRRLRKTIGDSATLATTLASSGQAAGQVTSYLHTDWGILAEANATGQIQASYGWSPQRDNGVAPLYARVPVRDAAGNATADFRYTYYHNDHQGTPQRLTDKAGNLLWSAKYDAYGKAVVQTTASAQLATVNPLRQPGQYLDAETGLHYNDRRYYDTDTGRYVSRDPIGFEGGINLYGYAGASPSRFTDPTGEIIPCMAYNYARCMVVCGLQSAAINAATGECIDIGQIAKDCAVDCLLSMLPIPDPCGKFGKLFSAAVGLASGLANSFEQDTVVHTRVLTDTGYQARLKPIKDIEVGDEVLAWDELQAHDNAALAQAGQAAQTLQAAYQQAGLVPRLDTKTASSPINMGASSYENKSNFSTLSSVIPAQRYEKVTDTISSFKEQTLLHISLDNGQTIQATAGHPFKTLEGWRDAVLLKKGGQLLLGGEADAVERFATILEIREEVKTTAVFNLEVANLHTFFVGVEGVVVHNGVRQNNAAGNAHRDQTAADRRAQGQDARTEREVEKPGIRTPYGMRFPDVWIFDAAGSVKEFLECKKGKSRYTPQQRKKDDWIRNNLNIPTTVVRG